ncbi:Protein kinase-like domain [Pseudocohnilembus persalinus]|uniref:Protein kinase-like domain n=1 Tax=Pseudocohnilembus persalinus TaxID=266149 RepID=A0A0V0R750_PSEPJ|nr:Protein kinase-like domain [Pseudocohnilembus persalinus]|eukprot:KRX10306.1 Protein kinase-like domain [Pseudocohnilembus persalinus]
MQPERKGTYAKVVLVRKIQDGELYAMKILKKKHIKDNKQAERLFAEKEILIKCDHPFIIKMKWCFQNSEKLYFVLDFVQGGELFNLIVKFQRFSEEVCKFYSAQMVLAIQYMHENGIIYRDLKPENVLIDRQGYIRITDFGLSKKNIRRQNEAFSIAGTPEYLAPEILVKSGHGKAVDYWALGCILYEMYTGDPPFMMQQTDSEMADRQTMFDKIKNQQIQLPKKCSPEFKDLLLGLFDKNPEKRLGIDPQKGDIKNHPWYSKCDWENLLKKQVRAPWVPKIKSADDTNHFDDCITKNDINSIQENSLSLQDQENIPGFTWNHHDMSPGTQSPKNEQVNQGQQELKMEEEFGNDQMDQE